MNLFGDNCYSCSTTYYIYGLKFVKNEMDTLMYKGVTGISGRTLHGQSMKSWDIYYNHLVADGIHLGWPKCIQYVIE